MGIGSNSIQIILPLEDKDYGPWIRTHNCDPAGRALADKHYSRQTIGAARFTRPGKNIVLRTPKGDAIWASWIGKFRRDGLDAYECTIFRNESEYMSSYLIALASLITFSEGHKKDGIITYVDERKVKSINPGFCFQSVGYRKIGYTKVRGLAIYQLTEERLNEYFKTIDKKEEYKQYFESLYREAVYWAKNDEIYEAITMFAKAKSVEDALKELYRVAKNKMKFHLYDKKEFRFFPDLSEFLLSVYGDWVPMDELTYWEQHNNENQFSLIK